MSKPIASISVWSLNWPKLTLEPRTVLNRAIIVYLFSIGFGLLYPGIVSFYSGTFFTENVVSTISKKADLKSAYDQFISDQTAENELAVALETVNHFLLDPSSITKPDQLSAAISLHEQLLKQKSSRTQHIIISPFYLGSTMLLWPAFYFFVGLLIFVFPPPTTSGPIPLKKVALATISIYVLYRWPSWWRNTALGHYGRKYFGNSNLDVDPYSFAAQETLGFVVAIYIALLLLQWVDFLRKRTVETEAEVKKSNSIDIALSPESANRLASTFFHWQAASILLGLGFFAYTMFFWQTVFIAGDVRYLPHAVIVHSLWLLSWIVISLPLLVTALSWRNARAQAIFNLLRERKTSEYDPELALRSLEAIEPVTQWNIVASTAAALGSLLLPVLHTAIGK